MADEDPNAGAGDGGNGQETLTDPGERWSELLPDETKSLGDFSKFKSLGDLASSYANLESRAGSSVQIPGEDATPEQKAEFFSRLGRPEKSESYELPKLESMPDGAISDARLGEFRSIAHAEGLSQRQVARLYAAYGDWVKDDLATFEGQGKQRDEENQAKVKQEHGAAFDQNLTIAQRAVRGLEIEGLQEAVDQVGLGNNPAMFNAFVKIGKMMAEDTIVTGNTGQGFAMTPDQAKREIGAKKLDAEFMKAWGTRNHPGHLDAVQELRKLHEFANPEPAKT
jgi:hypothetical protein